MRLLNIFYSALAAFFYTIDGVHGQTQGTYTDAATGITFATWDVPPSQVNEAPQGLTIGYALPPDAATVAYPDYIGLIIGPIYNGSGWTGISHSGSMANSLLLMLWAYQNKIYTSFRFATGYVTPDLYTGTNAQVKEISSSVNSTSFTFIFDCIGCYYWNQTGNTGNADTSIGFLIPAWSQAWSSKSALVNPADPNTSEGQHDTQGNFGIPLSAATNSQYSSWFTKTKTVTATASATTTATTTTSTIKSVPIPTGTTFDYVVVGGGAGGVPMADKLSEAGKTTLLIERGPPSSGRWGGTMKPSWLVGTNLTRFDVPGLCNQIWVDSAGIACTDTDQMAGCVLGGGTAVNAGLWWKPNPADWDVNFPTGWKSTDMVPATNRVFGRIPGTDHPSLDNKLYNQQGYDVITSGLAMAGWKNLTHVNDYPQLKNRTFGQTEYMFSNGERGGPLATYLVTSKARNNFKLWMNTTVKRVIRTGGHVTGVEVEAFGDGGYKGIVNVTQTTGRVVLAAGTFGTAKILFRSGIGPADQLAVVNASSDGPTMVDSKSWINLPVGYNLDDHVNTDTVISHPNVTFYDFYAAWTNPIPTDKANYLSHRSGILAMAAPNINPMFWEEITGADGIVRQLQWTARVEGSLGAPNGNTMTLSQYLGRGATSRGRTTINANLNMVVSTVPYLHDPNDVAAVIQGIENLQAALSKVKNLTWVDPAPGTSATDYVNNMVVATGNRRANHWIGSAKLGTNDGRSNGDAVVDLNTKVYGTDNLFVMDASIFPGMVSTNPSALIVTASEHASEKILALAPASLVPKFGQCAGSTYNGNMMCVAGTTCTYKDAFYSQCL